MMVQKHSCFQVVTNLPGIETEVLKLSTKVDQINLLQQVLMASDAEAEEEDIKDDLFDGYKSESKVIFIVYSCPTICQFFTIFQFVRQEGSSSSLSGGQGTTYFHVDKSKKDREKERHPLFKRFRKQ